jgi:hypothetical protein
MVAAHFAGDAGEFSFPFSLSRFLLGLGFLGAVGISE